MNTVTTPTSRVRYLAERVLKNRIKRLFPKTLAAKHGGNIVEFNDRRGRKLDDILLVLDPPAEALTEVTTA